MGVSKTSDHIQIKTKMPNPSQEPYKPQMKTSRTWMFFAPSKSRKRAKNQTKDVSKTTEFFKIKKKLPEPSQELPASSKARDDDLKEMDVLCTIKVKLVRQNSDF